MQKLKDWLLYPYANCLLFTVLVWILYSTGTVWQNFAIAEYRCGLHLAAMYYVFAYMISLVVGLYKPISGVLKAIVIIVFGIYFSVNVFCISVYNTTITPDIMAIIRATNYDETKEFLMTYIGAKEILFMVGFVIALWAILRADNILRRFLNKYRYLSAVPIVFLILAILSVCRNYRVLVLEFDSESHWIFNAEEIIDLRLHKTNPTISETDSIHPSQVVILVGESFAKNHSSLYGYDKPTNPCLEKLQADSALIVFEDVTSPTTFTVGAFKYILNDYRLEGNPSDLKWYDSTTIIEAMSKAGYYTMWISNQSPYGMYDNLPSGYSRLCDKSYFNPHTGAGKYDEYLLTIDTDTATAAHDKCLIIYHLMGQHEMFDKRFPESFRHFTADDYPNRPPRRAKIISDYDNATLYNDYVVGEIINSYKDHEAIVIYFPDHGIDVFDVTEHFGHAGANAESIEHCKKIPFVVYISPALDRKAPNIKKNLMLEKDKAMCTDTLFDLVLRIAGYAKQ